MRICFFGDSFTAGIGDDAALGWVGRICASARRSGVPIEGYNLGIRGDTARHIFTRWEAEADARLSRSAEAKLVFAFGTNDALQGVADDRFLDDAARLLTLARSRYGLAMLGPLPVTDDTAANNRIGELSLRLGALCLRLNLPYLPLFGFALECDVWMREAAARDGAHPGEAGYSALADFIGRWRVWQDWLKLAMSREPGHAAARDTVERPAQSEFFSDSLTMWST